MALSKVKKGGITDTAIKQGLPSSTVSGSAQLASAISGSLGSNASIIRSLTRDRISGSLGSNKSLIRTLTRVGVSGSFTAVSSSLAARITSEEGEAEGSVISSSAQIASDISGSFTAASSSFSTRVTTEESNVDTLQSTMASEQTNIDNLQTDSGSFSTRVTALKTDSGSFSSRTTTLEGSGTIQGVGTTDSPTFADLTATGTVTAQEFHTEFVSSSILYTSGSTRFGNSSDDIHQFTGSVHLTNSGSVSGSVFSTGSFGRVEATNFSGDGSGLSGITVPTAADISGSWQGVIGSGSLGMVSGSSVSTGSFGHVSVAGVLKTGDLELENKRGHWRIVEESEYLSITNVNTNKKYKILMEEIE